MPVSKERAEIVEVEVDDQGGDEVLIETKACGVCMEEIYIYRGLLLGGRVVGHEGVGAVVKVGEDVENVDVGDVVTTLGGLAFAEYYKTKGCNVARIPSDIDDYTLWISESLACVVNGIRGALIEIVIMSDL